MNLAAPERIDPVLPSTRAWALHDAAQSRRIEQEALAQCPPTLLMERAGAAVARLARAVAPGARTVWVACGPGNNGGDGLVAARLLHEGGWTVRVSLLADATRLPPDAAQALARAQAAGVPLTSDSAPECTADLAIDALLGLGATRAPQGRIAAAIAQMRESAAPVLAIDLPSGLAADTGTLLGPEVVRAAHTLSLLTLKPGLFTHYGRDHAGRIWYADLGVDCSAHPPAAILGGPPPEAPRTHSQHKGSFGDVIALGGAPGMTGAALLAARAALAAGAGLVFLCRLDGLAHAVDPGRPELMPRAPAAMLQPTALARMTLACGCGGGTAITAHLPVVLHHSARLVLDADALNAIAQEPALADALRARARRALPTLLTPHPLEAARLLDVDVERVQADRIGAATELATRHDCTVVLKGSGTVIASPRGATRPPVLNPTGNARLASAGTGDVLAGWLAGRWAQAPASDGRAAAEAAVWLHGRAADAADPGPALRAADLIDAMAAAREPR